MADSEKTIWVSIPNGTVVSAFLMSEALQVWLRASLKVVVLAPEHSVEAFRKHFETKNVHVELLHDYNFNPKQTFRWNLAQASFRKRKKLRSVHLGYMYDCAVRGWKGKLNWLLWNCVPESERLEATQEKLVRLEIPDLYHELFEKYPPDLVFLNDPYQSIEMALFEFVNRRNVKTIMMSHSWDNMTARGFQRVRAKKLLTWNAVNREEALRIHDRYHEDDVMVTGIPLFDVYADLKSVGTREDYFDEVGLDPKKKLILYTGITERGCPFQAQCDVVEAIAEAVNRSDLPPANILFRVHPKSPGGEALKDWADRLGVTLHVPRGNDRFDDGWIPGKDEINFLARTVAHADVSINMASTLLLHAAILKIPVICPRYDGKKKYPYERSLRRGYDYEHNVKILDFGYAAIVDNDKELIEALQKVFSGKRVSEEIRQKLLDAYAHKTDGQSSVRAAQAVLDYLFA